MTQEPASSCLIVTAHKKQVDKLNLVDAASQICFKNDSRYRIDTSPQSLTKELLRGPKHQIKGAV